MTQALFNETGSSWTYSGQREQWLRRHHGVGTRAEACRTPFHASAGHQPDVHAVDLDVHFVSPTPVPSWERRAPARLWKPRWSVALPGKTLGELAVYL